MYILNKNPIDFTARFSTSRTDVIKTGSGRYEYMSDIVQQKFHWARVPKEWMETMNRRRQMLFQMCQNQNETIMLGTPIKVSKHEIPDRNYVDDISRIILCPISKSGSRTWLKIYFKLNGQMNTSVEYNQMPLPYFEPYVRKLKTYTDFGIHGRVNSYLKIMTVRHPLVRLVSAYKEQVAPTRGLFRKLLEDFLIKRKGMADVNKTRTVTFVDFLQFTLEYPNIHWDTFNTFCAPCKMQYDLVVYFETLADDAKNVLSLLGADDKIKLPPSHRADQMSSDDEARQYYQGVDRDLLKQVIAKYWAEEKYFGYNMNKF
ncbi:carbohydrate sulfotransferase 9-like [Lingula anatina]|uniref:Carbohydrate sulfotransferase n=1 Tax=Lingula anatina TaxID=7574 RepID=A0A1S3H8F8_LINAN|nr:carbohydrate sulfotransferase 9-like [Lingula anatina]|eukprot:XP_013381404.1 carbohydrate sulfotransferase 9-like [Lingula anatina]